MSYIKYLVEDLNMLITPKTLLKSRNRRSIQLQLKKLFGNISDKRAEQLEDGNDFKNEEERIYYELARKYQADMEYAAVGLDEDELNNLYNNFKIEYEKFLKDNNYQVQEIE
jgi:hypothetical protein